MYSSLKNIQILVSLLKKYNIKHIVISAGTRHTPLVHSIENDSFFKTYSIVDERSASFFALGIIQQIKEPVAICCTSGTASANYVSAANEAFFQQLPLLILTADRNPYYKFQQEEQMIPQENLFKDICKKIITLSHVRDEKDFWYNSRICNEALLELTDGEKGPVHINYIVENDYPIFQGIIKFEEKILPNIKKIDRLTLEDSNKKWQEYAEKFKNSKILIIYGQNSPITEEELKIIDNFSEKYNCIISTDILSNLKSKYSISTYSICKTITSKELNKLCPDIIITMNANSLSDIKNSFAPLRNKFKHIHVSSKGNVSDPFKCLPDIIACSPMTFFKKFFELGKENLKIHSYYDKWLDYYKRIGQNGSLNNEKCEYSGLYVTQQLIKNIPENSLVHIGNSMSIRFAGYFNFQKNVEIYCNRGTNGIDGSMSSFIGQAYVSQKPSFLLIGDLSFFYDMNALWNQYINKNLKIIVINNSGGAIFYKYPGEKNIPTLAKNFAAVHSTSIKDWAISRGFKYLSSKSKKEADNAIKEMIYSNQDYPIILEAFTDKNIDVNEFDSFLNQYKIKSTKQKIWEAISNCIIKNKV